MNIKNVIVKCGLVGGLILVSTHAGAQTADSKASAVAFKRFSYGINFGTLFSGAALQKESGNSNNLSAVDIGGRTGFQFGATALCYLNPNKKWAIRAGSNLSFFNTHLNYKWKTGESNNVKLEALTVSVPLVLMRDFVINEKNKFYVFAGVRGDYNFTSNADKVYQNFDENLATKSAFLMTDLGLGIKRSMDLVDAGLELHFNQSFTNVLIRQNQHVYSQSLSALRPTLMSLNLIFQN